MPQGTSRYAPQGESSYLLQRSLNESNRRVPEQLEIMCSSCPFCFTLFVSTNILQTKTTRASKAQKVWTKAPSPKNCAVQEAQGRPNHQGTSQTGWQRTPVRNREGQSPGSNTAPDRCLLGLVLHLLQRRSEPSLGSKVHHVAFEHFCIASISIT